MQQPRNRLVEQETYAYRHEMDEKDVENVIKHRHAAKDEKNPAQAPRRLQ